MTLSANNTHACSVPVFRYALELWEPYPYQIALFYRDSLSAGERIAAQELAGKCMRVTGDSAILGAYSHSQVKSNAELNLINIRDTLGGWINLWRMQDHPTPPWVAVYFPKEMRNPAPVASGKLNEMAALNFFDSPVRRSVATAISHGRSAVWIFVASGNAGKDKAALAGLQEGLRLSREKIKLPALDSADIKEVVQKSPLELKIDFSSVTVSRSDPREWFLIGLLEKSEPLIAKFANEPLAFPVFGRGRVLYVLAAKGITKENVLDADGFLSGPCACTIKDQNPGTDLLTQFDWKEALHGNSIASAIDQAPLQLSGLGAYMEAAKKNGTGKATLIAPAGPQPSLESKETSTVPPVSVACTVPTVSDSAKEAGTYFSAPVRQIIVKSEAGSASATVRKTESFSDRMLRYGFPAGTGVLLLLLGVTFVVNRRKKQ